MLTTRSVNEITQGRFAA